MVHVPMSSDLKSPKSIVSPQPSPSAAALSKDKWPVVFVSTGCVAQNLAVGSLHLSQSNTTGTCTKGTEWGVV